MAWGFSWQPLIVRVLISHGNKKKLSLEQRFQKMTRWFHKFLLQWVLILSIIESEAMTSDSVKKVLVVGATGATGKHVVQMLLDKGQKVQVIARSKDKMISLLKEKDYGDNLSVTEASVFDITEEQLQEQVKDCQAVVSCLGHNIDFSGLFGKPHRLVTDTAKRLTMAMPNGSRFILMGSAGVSHPDGTTDRVRSLPERMVLSLLRNLLPPHADNEAAALYLHEHRDFNWAVVRPTNLIDGDVSEYNIYAAPTGSLFGSEMATRANVADFMVDLILNDEKWGQYKHRMPVLQDPVRETGKKD
jgi:putative NADH-flavin reductase